MSGLVEFEFRVVQLFFEVAASNGFVLAGRTALVATSMADRVGHEIEFLGSSGEVDLDGISDDELPCNRYQGDLMRAAFAGWADDLR